MGLLDTIRSAVATADSVTKDLQADVYHTAWVGQDGNGTPMWAPTTNTEKAIVEKSTRVFRSQSGDLMQARHRLTFVYPIAPNGEPGRREPVDERDKLVVAAQCEITGPIVHIEEFVDRVTGRGILTQVWIG